MLLAVDVGNSNITLGLFQGEQLAATWRMSTDVRRTRDEYAATLWTLLARSGIRPEEIRAAALSNVVPPLQDVIEGVCNDLLHVKPLIVTASTPTGIRIKVDYAFEVGADRIVNAAAALVLYGLPALVIDFGTATTFDAISADGAYLGGAIAPGIAISAEALFERASKLPRVALKAPPAAIGHNTVNSMQSGLIFGYVGLVEGLVKRIRDELGGTAVVVATGGLAETIAQETKVIEIVDPDLTLHGLRVIWGMSQ